MNPFKQAWADRLSFLGLAIEDADYHVWGSSPVWGEDGRVHVFCSRIPKDPGFDRWWATSQIARYVADGPAGPYTFVEVLLEPGQTPEGQWDCGTQHNPSITRVGGLYVLSYHASKSTPQHRDRPSQLIGMMTARSVHGPWTKHGIVLPTPTHEQAPDVPPGYDGGTDNPALLHHPDGRFYLYYRIKFPGLTGENTYGVAIADDVTGPYTFHPTRVINNPTYVEDPYVFVHDGLIYMLVTDNAHGTGLLMSSTDGLHFDYHDGAPGFGTVAGYVPRDQWPPPASHGRGGKFERPQLLMTDGAPTHLFMPSGTNLSGGSGTCCYVLAVGPT